LEIRAGVIRSVANHPSADKLYVLTVDLGEPSLRTVVAGIRPSYSPEALTGQSLVLLANLAPRTIRRMTSQGMLLAVDAGERSVLLVPPSGVNPGQVVEGTGTNERTISYEEFASVALRVGQVRGSHPSGGREVDLGDRTVAVPGEWAPGETVVVRLDDPEANEGTVLSFAPGGAIRPLSGVPVGAKVR
jgi:methionine--tRNA ligase beta chain